MSNAYIIDTSYILELFCVPGCSCDKDKIIRIYEKAIAEGSHLYVTLPCVYEVANIIAQVSGGEDRKKLSKTLFSTIKSCVTENIPWTIVPHVGVDYLPRLCEVFAADYAVQGVGLTDTSVVYEAKRLKEKYTNLAKVHIWTKDITLKAQEPDTENNPFVG